MNAFAAIRQSADYQALLTASARLGANPLQVQAAGGNSSIKQDGAMWVKASGLWLAQARAQDIMVPVRADALLDALLAGDPAAEKAQDFVPRQDNPQGLRPSIETTLHAVFPHRVVIHSHCVATIATAIRADAAQRVADRLGDLDAIFVPYCKPGVVLAQEIGARLRPDTKVIVLGNHGLVAGGDRPDAAEAVLNEASRRLAPERVAVASGDRPEALAGADYEVAADDFLHDIACDRELLALTSAGSYYPDHVIFLGPGIVVTRKGESAGAAAKRVESARGIPPALIFVPGAGALIRRAATTAERALAGCLAAVFARVDRTAELVTLTGEDEAELLQWDAEKYRQSLDAQRGSV